MTKNLLAIDSTTNSLHLALLLNAGESVVKKSFNGVKVSENIHQKIADLLAENQLELAQIDGFVVSRGPGSFTGIRVGIATAQGLALPSQKPVIAVDSFTVLQNQTAAHHPNQPIAVIIDAYGGDVYLQNFDKNGSKQGAAQVVAATEIDNFITDNCVVCGSECSIDPAVLAKLGLQQLQSNKISDLTPIYLKKLTYRKLNEQHSPR